MVNIKSHLYELKLWISISLYEYQSHLKGEMEQNIEEYII